MRNLRLGETADYSRAERIFTDGLRRRGFPADAPFDWMAGHHPVKAAVAVGAGGTGAGGVGGRVLVGTAGAAGAAAGVGGGRRGVDVRGVSRGLDIGETGSAASAAAVPMSAKRPRLGSDSLLSGVPAVSGTGGARGEGFGSGGGGHRGGLKGRAVFDLYADVPPPDIPGGGSRGDSGRGAASERGGGVVSGVVVEGKATKEVASNGDSAPATKLVAGATGGNGVRGSALTGTDDLAGESSGGACTATVHPQLRVVAGALHAGSPGVVPSGSPGAATAAAVRAGSPKGSKGGAAVVDVSVALGKLRPHLVGGGGGSGGGGGGSKKFPRACALLADLLSAKLGPDNEEVFFVAVVGAVEHGGRAGDGGGGSGNGSGSGGSDGGSGVSTNSPRDGTAVESRTLLRADGAAGEAVRRLVKAACARSAVFSERRRETVEAWGKEVAAFSASQGARSGGL